jgi:hypothetical protein
MSEPTTFSELLDDFRLLSSGFQKELLLEYFQKTLPHLEDADSETLGQLCLEEKL